MSNEGLTCPYCNAAQPPRPGLAVGQRVTCPRCGEVFAVKALPEAITTGPPAAGRFTAIQAGPPAPAPALAARRRLGNRPLAVVILSVMLLMGGIGLAYALVTQDYRRHNDTSLPRKTRKLFPGPDDPAPAPEGPTAPARLEGLAYLPRSTNVLAGTHVPSLRAHPRWANLKALRVGAGPAALTLEQIVAWTGLDEAEIDHVLIGTTLRAVDPPELTPAITLVLRTTRDHDAAKVRKALQAKRPVLTTSADGTRRSVYTSAKLGRLPASLWQADARTAVVGIFDIDLKQVPGKPHAGADELPAEVSDALATRLTGDPPLWAIGHSEDWTKTVVATLLAPMKNVPLTDQLGKVRTLVLSLVVGTPDKLLWQVRAADEPTAREIEAKVLAPRAKADPKGMKTSRNKAWLSVQMEVDLAASR